MGTYWVGTDRYWDVFLELPFSWFGASLLRMQVSNIRRFNLLLANSSNQI